MKKLNDYKDEIHRCSKCGLCQSVCPIYEETGNDCAVSRGKFIMLNGIIKGDLKLNKNINKYLDMCSKCNACKNFCPSNIDAREIFLAAKAEYFKKCPSSFFVKLFHSNFNLILNLVKPASKTYRALKVDNLARKFYPLLLKMGWLGKKAILANEFLTNNVVETEATTYTANQNKAKTAKVIYFKGCVNEFINPRTKIAAEKILEKVGAEILPITFQCCGVPFLSSGNVEQFKKQALFNLSQIPDGIVDEIDYFLTDCASCQDAFKQYKNYLDDNNDDDKRLLEKLEKINSKSINIVEFVFKQVKTIEFEEKMKFTFHKPCHMEDTKFLKTFLNMAKNIEYIEMKDYDKCCGFAGEFAIKNINLSTKISSKKAQNIIKSKADCVVTSCPACILGIKQGMIETQESIPAINFIEFLSIANFKLNSEYENKDCNKNLLDAFVKKCF